MLPSRRSKSIRCRKICLLPLISTIALCAIGWFVIAFQYSHIETVEHADVESVNLEKYFKVRHSPRPFQWISKRIVYSNEANGRAIDDNITVSSSPWVFAVKTFERPECLKTIVAAFRRFHKEIPIFIADDSINDQMADAVADEWKDDPYLSYIRLEPDVGVSYGRNVLTEVIADARFPFLVISDDDYQVTNGSMLPTLFERFTAMDADLLAPMRCEVPQRSNTGITALYSYRCGRSFGSVIKSDGGVLEIVPLILSTSSSESTIYAPNTETSAKDPSQSLPFCLRTDLLQHFFIARTETLVNQIVVAGNNSSSLEDRVQYVGVGWDDTLKNNDHYDFLLNIQRRGLQAYVCSDLEILHIKSECASKMTVSDHYTHFRENRWRKLLPYVLRKWNINSIVDEKGKWMRKSLTDDEKVAILPASKENIKSRMELKELQQSALRLLNDASPEWYRLKAEKVIYAISTRTGLCTQKFQVQLHCTYDRETSPISADLISKTHKTTALPHKDIIEIYYTVIWTEVIGQPRAIISGDGVSALHRVEMCNSHMMGRERERERKEGGKRASTREREEERERERERDSGVEGDITFYASQSSATVYLVTPILNDLAHLKRLCANLDFLYRRDRNFVHVVVDFGSTDGDYEELLSSFQYESKVVKVGGGRFSRSIGLHTGIMYVKEVVDEDALLFALDTSMVFPFDFLHRIRLYTHCTKTVYIPICFRIRREFEGNGEMDEKTLREIMSAGGWAYSGYGMIGVCLSDYERIGGYDTERWGYRWGAEDVDIVHRLYEAGLLAIRRREEGYYYYKATHSFTLDSESTVNKEKERYYSERNIYHRQLPAIPHIFEAKSLEDYLFRPSEMGREREREKVNAKGGDGERFVHLFSGNAVINNGICRRFRDSERWSHSKADGANGDVIISNSQALVSDVLCALSTQNSTEFITSSRMYGHGILTELFHVREVMELDSSSPFISEKSGAEAKSLWVSPSSPLRPSGGSILVIIHTNAAVISPRAGGSSHSSKDADLIVIARVRSTLEPVIEGIHVSANVHHSRKP